jgi:hypothetical protein
MTRTLSAWPRPSSLLRALACLLVSGCAAVSTETYSDAEDEAYSTAAKTPAATLAWHSAVATAGSASANGAQTAPWTHTVFPGKKASLYSPVQMDGRDGGARRFFGQHAAPGTEG